MKYIKINIVFILFTIIYNTSCAQKIKESDMTKSNQDMNSVSDTTTFGSGCFWCTEAVFQELKGVHKVVSGYSEGHIKNPSYTEVRSGITGNAEVCQVTFDLFRMVKM